MRKAVNHAWLTYQHGQVRRCWPGRCPSCCATPRPPTPAYGGDAGAPRRPTCSGRCTRSPRRRCASWASTSWPGWPPTGRSRCPSGPATRCWPASPPPGSATRWSRWAGPGPRWRSTSTSPTGSRRAAATRPPPSGCPSTGCCCSRARWPRPGSATRATVRDLLSGAAGGGQPARRRRQLLLDLASARRTSSCTAPRPPWSWARAGGRSRCTSAIDRAVVRRAAARAPGAPPARHRPRATRRSATWRGQRDAARGDRLAPSEIRCRPIAHEVCRDVLRRTRGAPPAPVAELAEQMGVGV